MKREAKPNKQVTGVVALAMFALMSATIFVFGASNAAAQKRAVSKSGNEFSLKIKNPRRTAKRDKDDRESERSVTVVRNGKKYILTEEKDLKRFDQPGEAQQWYLQKRLAKGERTLSIERYFQAKEKIKKMRQFSTARGKILPSQEQSGINFSESSGKGGNSEFSIDALTANGGSTGGALGTWKSLGPGNVGGRTRALLIDPNNTDVMYAGAVAGGVWKTTNGGTSWNALDDFMANIAVTTLAFDPTNTNTIYAGTGEGFFNGDSIRGAGIFKSTDAGATWTRLSATANNADFYYVNDLVVSPINGQRIYAATRSGVMRSTDGGSSWSLSLASNAANGANGAMDLVIRTDQSTDYIFAALGTAAQSHIYRNVDASGVGTWTDVYTEATMGRTSLAIAPNNQNVVYALASNASTNAMLAVFRSAASGDAGSWIAQVRSTSPNKQDTLLLSNPVYGVLATCGLGTANQLLNQGWYDNQIVVDPTDENKVWAAGIDLWRSDNGGVNWGVASYWWFQGNGTPPNNGDPQLAHADNHTIVFDPNYNGTTNQTMFVGNDGGVYKTSNAKAGNVGYVNGITPSGGTVTSASPICGQEYAPGGFFTVPSPVIWGPLNNGYGVTQFWQGSIYPDGKTYFGGTQDNGTNRGTDTAGPNAWSRILGGDGGYAAVDPTNTNVLYAENTNLSFQKSTNGGANFSTRTSGINEPSGNFLFTAPFFMDPNNSQRLYLGGARLWRTNNGATAWASASGFLGTRVSAIGIAPSDSNYVIVGSQVGTIFRTTTATTDAIPAGTNTTWGSVTPRADLVSWVAFDPTDKNIAYATYSAFNSNANVGHIWKSVNAGATWTKIDGTGVNAIPDIPVHSIVVDPNNPLRLYVGTDLGVFVTLDGGSNWFKETSGFSNVVTESLAVQNNNGITSIFAFTHGRGAFKVTIPSSCASLTLPTTQQFYSPGASGTVGVTGVAGCDWNAVSNDGFITVNSGAAGDGNGTVGITVAPNTGATARTGTLTIAGQTVTINQDAAPKANNDSASTNEDTAVNINVLGNDSDPDGDTINVTAITQGTNGAVAINSDGTVKYSPAANYFGTDSFTYTIGDGHGGASTATVNVTIISVNDLPVVTNNQTGSYPNVQYSDPIQTITVTASDVETPAGSLAASTTFSRNGGAPQNGLPLSLSFTQTGTAGVWELKGNFQTLIGTYSITTTFTDADGGKGSTTVVIIVVKEDAVVVVSSPESLKVATPGGKSPSFAITAKITEVVDGTPGSISNAQPVTITLSPVGSGSSYSCTTPTITVSGGMLTATCNFNNVDVNVYDVSATIGANNYYQGTGRTVLTVYDSSLGFLTGSGSIKRTVNGETFQADFDVSVKYLKNGNIEGSILYIEHHASGDITLTSNTMSGLAIIGTEGKVSGKATLNGVGDYSFVARLIDNEEPGKNDKFSIRITNPLGTAINDLSFDLMTLTGGNIQVHKGK